jgi:hypothetical protein
MMRLAYAALVPAIALAFWTGSQVGAGAPVEVRREQNPLVIGDTLPNAIIHNFGAAASLRSLAETGKTVIIVASAGCNQCLAEMTNWNELAQSFPDISFLALACGPRPDELPRLQQLGRPNIPTYYCDGFTIEKLRVTRTPTIYVTTDLGRLVFVTDGIDSTASLERFLDGLKPE